MEDKLDFYMNGFKDGKKESMETINQLQKENEELKKPFLEYMMWYSALTKKEAEEMYNLQMPLKIKKHLNKGGEL